MATQLRKNVGKMDHSEDLKKKSGNLILSRGKFISLGKSPAKVKYQINIKFFILSWPFS